MLRIEGIVTALPLATPSEATVRALDDISDTVRRARVAAARGAPC